MPRSTVVAAEKATPVVRLHELPQLAAALVARVRGAGFNPDVLVYIETGARLLAHEMAGATGWPVEPVWARRGGYGVKRLLAPLARNLPVTLRDWLRRVEERTGIHRLTSRHTHLNSNRDWSHCRVVLVDDAADTGRTLNSVRELLLSRGVRTENLRTAVLAVTTPLAHSAVDFFVLDRNCRMPWSADSEERIEAEQRASLLAPK